VEQAVMMRRVFCAVAAIAIGTTLSAASKKTADNAADAAFATAELTMRTPDESAPAGAMVQMKVLTTEVTPISGGRPGFGYDAAVFGGAAGFGIMAPNGEAAGAAIIDGSRVQITYSGTSLLTADYPILTVVLSVRPDAIAGSKTPFGFDPTSVWEYAQAGPVTARISPATVTVAAAGSTSISDVVPGEGVWPAGTVVSVHGTGFDAGTSLKVNDTPIGDVRLVNATEMQFALLLPTEIRGLRITATGKNSVTYYAYMRGLTARVSARTLLAKVEPIFSTAQRTVATIAPALSMSGSQYEAVALQNPNLGAVTVGLSLHAADGTVLYETSRTMSARERLALEASELLDGIAPPAGATIVVTASQPIDAFSLLCDEAAQTVMPALPLEAQ
jgi:hypothetical protein